MVAASVPDSGHRPRPSGVSPRSCEPSGLSRCWYRRGVREEKARGSNPSAGLRSTDPPMQARDRARGCRSRGVSVSRVFGPAGVTLMLPGHRTLIGHFPRSRWVETAPDTPSGPGTVDGVRNATRGIRPGQRLFHGETSRNVEVRAPDALVQGVRGSSPLSSTEHAGQRPRRDPQPRSQTWPLNIYSHFSREVRGPASRGVASPQPWPCRQLRLRPGP